MKKSKASIKDVGHLIGKKAPKQHQLSARVSAAVFEAKPEDCSWGTWMEYLTANAFKGPRARLVDPFTRRMWTWSTLALDSLGRSANALALRQTGDPAARGEILAAVAEVHAELREIRIALNAWAGTKQLPRPGPRDVVTN